MKLLFTFLKIPSIRCDRAIFKIRSHEGRSSAPSRRRLRPPQTQRKKSNLLKQLFGSFLNFVVARPGNQRSAGLSSQSALLADGLVWNYESVDKGRFTPA